MAIEQICAACKSTEDCEQCIRDLKYTFILALEGCKVPNDHAIGEIQQIYKNAIPDIDGDERKSMETRSLLQAKCDMTKKFYEIIIERQKKFMYGLWALKHERMDEETNFVINTIASKAVLEIEKYSSMYKNVSTNSRRPFDNIVEDSLKEMHRVYLEVSELDFDFCASMAIILLFFSLEK